jgi:hypothetical protein
LYAYSPFEDRPAINELSKLQNYLFLFGANREQFLLAANPIGPNVAGPPVIWNQTGTFDV